jgi:hypothetical protein
MELFLQGKIGFVYQRAFPIIVGVIKRVYSSRDTGRAS